MRLDYAISKVGPHLGKVKRYKDKTLDLYQYQLRDFSRFMKVKKGRDVTIGKISLADIDDYLLAVSQRKIDKSSRYYGEKETLSPGTVQIYSNSVRGLFKYINQKYPHIKAIDFRSITTIRVPKPKVCFLNDAEFEEFYMLPELYEKRQDVKLRNQLYILMLYVTGCRATEVLNLKFSDIREDSNQITIRGKGDKIRGVFINDRVRALLKRYEEVRKLPYVNGLGITLVPAASEYIFVALDGRQYGKPQNYESIQEYFKRYSDEAKMGKKITIHVLRHSFATKLLKKGVPLMHIKELMGHTNITTTQRYTHIEDHELERSHTMVFGTTTSFQFAY